MREWSILGVIQIILKGNEVMGTESPSTGVLLSKRDKTMVFIPHPQKVSKYLYLALPSYLKFAILCFQEKKKISQVETDRNFLDLTILRLCLYLAKIEKRWSHVMTNSTRPMHGMNKKLNKCTEFNYFNHLSFTENLLCLRN